MVKLPNNSCPVSIVPLPLRSRTSQASSELGVVQATRKGEPFARMSKSTPPAASVSLKPLPETSIKTGETQLGSSGLHSHGFEPPPSNVRPQPPPPPPGGVGVGDGALQVKPILIVPRLPVLLLQKLPLALQLGSGPAEKLQFPPISVSPAVRRFETSAPQSCVVGELPDRHVATHVNVCAVGQGN